MKVFKRGKFYSYRFQISGHTVRESAKTANKQLAEEAALARRRDLERGVNGLSKRPKKMPLFRVVAQEWLASRVALAPGTLDRYRHQAALLISEFGGRLVSDLTWEDVIALQQKRQAEGKAPRTINYEVMTLGMILRTHALWAPISERIKSLRQRPAVGRAIAKDDEAQLLGAVGRNDSPVLLPLFVLAMDTGLRAGEARSLQYKSLDLKWSDGAIIAGRLIVGKSKTAAGMGRTIPLTKRVCAILTVWLSRFPGAAPDSFVFPHHRVAVRNGGIDHHLYEINLGRPIGSWKRAWKSACASAKVTYRWHDTRHSFVSRLAENPNVSEETIRALAGHVSKQMLERYSHIRNHAKVAAIAALEGDSAAIEVTTPGSRLTQKWSQSIAGRLN